MKGWFGMFARLFGLRKSIKNREVKKLSAQTLPKNFDPKGLLYIPPKIEIAKFENPPLRKMGHLRVKQDLFTKPVIYNDVNQYKGNWFLFASLQAIAALPEGNEIIMGMMKDMGNHVVVRVFDQEGHPHYIAIEKSVPGNTILSAGELWVKMLEKAYTVWSLKNQPTLGLGQTETIINLLTGAHRQDVSNGLPLQTRQKLHELNNYTNPLGIIMFHALMTLNNSSDQQFKENILKQIFLNQTELLLNWVKWLQQKSDTWQVFWSNTHPINSEHVQQFFSEHAIPNTQDAFTHVTAWLDSEKILPGPKLSGKYSYEELNFFNMIKNQILHNSPIVVETDHRPQMGLVSNHSYAVIGYIDDKKSNRKFVFVCNPYSEDRNIFSKMFIPGGRKSRVIQKNHQGTSWKLAITSTKKSVACMELNDFTNSFKNFIHMESVSSDAIQARINKAK